MRLKKLIAGGAAGVILFGAVSPTIALPLASNGLSVKQSAPDTTTDVKGGHMGHGSMGHGSMGHGSVGHIGHVGNIGRVGSFNRVGNISRVGILTVLEILAALEILAVGMAGILAVGREGTVGVAIVGMADGIMAAGIMAAGITVVGGVAVGASDLAQSDSASLLQVPIPTTTAMDNLAITTIGVGSTATIITIITIE